MIQTDKQFLPVFAWGMFQVVILGIGAIGLPLWAHHPFPRESLAIQEILVGQAVIFALLFPIIVGKPLDLMMAITLMLPVDELAGMMSNTPQVGVWRGFGCVGLWVGGLGGLTLACKSRSAQVAISSVAVVLIVGGAILDYLRWETAATNGQGSVFLPASFLTELCSVNNGLLSTLPWMQAAMPVIALTVTSIIWLSISRKSSSSTSLHIPS